MNERILQADGIELATQTFGDPADPPVLLIMGIMASMLWWPDEFCQRLAARGRRVIRYDNRDTGRSTTYPPGSPGYTLDDMADDAVRVLDGHGVAAAHVVGCSIGGMIGQLAALKHPDRVATLSTISSSPFDSDLHQPAETAPAEAGPDEPAQATPPAEPDLTDRDQAVAFLVEFSRRNVGTMHPFDEAGLTRLVEWDFDRAHNFPSITNHVQLTGGEVWEGRLSEMQAPLLVIHGTADPVFPMAHGIELAGNVAGSTLIWIEGMGHELPEPAWDEIIAPIVRHTDPDNE